MISNIYSTFKLRASSFLSENSVHSVRNPLSEAYFFALSFRGTIIILCYNSSQSPDNPVSPHLISLLQISFSLPNILFSATFASLTSPYQTPFSTSSPFFSISISIITPFILPLISPSRLWVQIPSGTIDSFIWGSFLVSLRNIGGSTQSSRVPEIMHEGAPEIFLHSENWKVAVLTSALFYSVGAT